MVHHPSGTQAHHDDTHTCKQGTTPRHVAGADGFLRNPNRLPPDDVAAAFGVDGVGIAVVSNTLTPDNLHVTKLATLLAIELGIGVPLDF